MSTSDLHSQSPGQDARDAVADVLRHVEERDARRKSPPGGGRDPEAPRPGLVPLVAALACALAWVLIAPPAWVTPDPPPPPEPEALEEGLRMDMYVAALRIQAFRDSAGRLPLTLAEALQDPDAGRDIVYERTGDDLFVLQGTRAGSEIRWRSDAGEEALVGDALSRMGGRAR